MSGITPSGKLTIGHIFGCIQSWQVLAQEYQCYLGIMNLHALTVQQDPKQLTDNIWDAIALYIACGFDPNEHCLFIQSEVPQHTQLTWFLNCHTSIGHLMRMTQFKDKSSNQDDTNAGLLVYPILMAADILLYDTDCVPVGDDQKQHLELTRDIAGRINHKHGRVFKIPDPYIRQTGSRIMSLQDPLKKMSKSDPNQNSYIALTDSDNQIKKKIMRAVTDSHALVAYDENRPGISNLIELYQLLSSETKEAIENRYSATGYKPFKEDLADHLINFLSPIRERFMNIRTDQTALEDIARLGNEKAQQRAAITLKRLREKTGLMV